MISTKYFALAALVFISGSITFTEAAVGHGEACNQNQTATSCSTSQDITCRNGVCECDLPNDMEFDFILNRCVVLADGHCRKNSTTLYKCATNSNCNYNSEKCVCDYQRSPDARRYCIPSHGSSCVISSECNQLDKLVCAFEKCRCPLPLAQIWKSGRNKCFTMVGSPCRPNALPTEVSCDPEENQCLADSQSTTGYTCQCLPGFHIEHFERQCVRGNRSPCRNATALIHPPCDEVGGLRCYQDICQCGLGPDQAWDDTQKACAGTEGVGCVLDDANFQFSEYFYKCFTGLECVPFQGHKFEGICRKVTKNREIHEFIQ